MSPTPAAIINADDLGCSPRVNTAICRAFQHGWITSASVMANGDAFAEACELVHQSGVARVVGIHFVLTCGRPLTLPIALDQRFCDSDGCFRPRPRSGALAWLGCESSRAVAAELRAQIAKCRAAGLGPAHFDSHHHIHEEFGIARLVLAIVREEHIPCVRIIRNLRPPASPIRRIYSAAFNRALAASGLARTRTSGSAADFAQCRRKRLRAPVEIVVHPDLGADGTVVDRPGDDPLERAVNPVIAHFASSIHA